MVQDSPNNPSSASLHYEDDADLIEQQLAKILASRHFKSAKKMQAFLQYIVRKTLAGKAKTLKQYTIAVEALKFPVDFDSDINPVVRIKAGRVRERLTKYYDNEGKEDSIVISMPKGSYAPLFEKRNTEDERTSDFQSLESQGPKLGLFCFKDESLSQDSNLLLVHISSTLAKELSHYIFSRLYVQIPYMSDVRSDSIGSSAIKKYGIDFSLLLYVQELPKGKYELVYRLWNNHSQEVINSDIFKVYRGQPEEEQNLIMNKISAVIADFYQGKLHLDWGRQLLSDDSPIPEEYQTLAFYRNYADNQGRSAFEKAACYCSKALERNPNDVIANVIFADYCRRNYVYNFNAIDDALKKGRSCAETAIRLRPDSHEAHFVLGQIFFCLGKWELSTSEFNMARSISKNHAVIEYGTGFHFCLMGRWDEGLPLVKKAMSLSSTYPTWYHLTPFLNYYRQEKYDEALVESLKIKMPNLLHGPMARTAAYGQLGERKKAKEELQNLLTRCPDFLETGRQTLTRFLGTKELAEKIWDGILKAK